MVWRSLLKSVLVFMLFLAVMPYPSRIVYSGGAYRTPITISNNVASDLVDYQVKIVLDSSWDGWSNVASDGSDIYFLDANGNPLYYWIESFDAVNKQAVIWVKVSVPGGGSTTIYLYYGGTNDYPSYNDPSQVFDFYDDFESDPTQKYYVHLGSSVYFTYIDLGGPYDWSCCRPYLTVKFKVLVRVEADYGPVIAIGLFPSFGDDETATPNFHLAWSGYTSESNNVAVNVHDGSSLYKAYTNAYSIGDQYVYVVNAWFESWSTVAWSGDLGSGTNSVPDMSGKPINYLRIRVFDYDKQGFFQWDGSDWLILDVIRNSELKIAVDYIILRKYVSPEPSISIGSSEKPPSAGDPYFSASVSPSSFSGVPGDLIVFSANVSNTGGAGGWVRVDLVDHNGVVRSWYNVSLDPGSYIVLDLNTTATMDDRGDLTWLVLGYNDTTTFFNISVSVSIHASFDLSYSYTLSFSEDYNVTPIDTLLYNYSIGFSSVYDVDPIGSNDYNRIWGAKYGLSLYTNSSGSWSLVYQENGGTVYVLYINFVYNVTTAPYPDVPNGYIRIYDYDTNELVSSIYIPHGNTSVILYAGRYYRLEIPSSGPTLHGYGFKLDKYVVDGVENPPSILMSSDRVLTIYYLITNETVDPSDPAMVTIDAVARSAGVLYFEGTLYGGDEFYYNNKVVNGLIGVFNVSDNWFGLGSYDSVVVQYYGDYGVLGGGFYEGGNYYVVGYYINGSSLVSARMLITVSGSLQSISYVFQESMFEYYSGTDHYCKLTFYKGNVLAMIYANGKWYRVGANMSTTAISYVAFIGDSYPGQVTLMRGDYLIFRADNLLAVEIVGRDAAGNDVNIMVGDNSPQDVDPTPNVIMLQELPVVWPLNATVRLYFATDYAPSESFIIPPVDFSPSQWWNITWGNVSFSIGGNNSLVDAIKALGNNPIGRYALAVLPLLFLLFPNKKYGVISGFISVALLSFFNTILITSGLPIVVAWDALAVTIFVLIIGLFYELKD